VDSDWVLRTSEYSLSIFSASYNRNCPEEYIPQLVHHFVANYARKFGRNYESVPKSMMTALQEHSWPGYVRELQHVIERAVITIPGPVLRLAKRFECGTAEPGEGALKALWEMERHHIVKVLEKTGWKIAGANGAASVGGRALLGAIDVLSERAAVKTGRDAPWEAIDVLKKMKGRV